MLARLEEVLLQEKPDWVVVYGDTNSTLAGALAAAKLYIPVAHVEAGLRSYNRTMPEEINRVLTDHLSSLLFCPTDTAVRNLAREGINQSVHKVGDVMYDVALWGLEIAERKSTILETLGVDPGNYLLVTIHRPGNTDDPRNLSAIVSALNDVAERVIFPVHPRTQKALKQWGLHPNSNVRLIEPVSYLDMLMLEKNAWMILTDSGGVQKEAYILGVPCVTLREETEWVETVEAGWNILVGANRERIVEAVRNFQPTGERPPLFGDGNASRRIVEILTQESTIRLRRVRVVAGPGRGPDGGGGDRASPRLYGSG
jgi:UDP-GlcNAc3NAcA epimerase